MPSFRIMTVQMDENICAKLKAYNESGGGEIPDDLADIIEQIAAEGHCLYPWHLLKQVIRDKAEEVIDAFNTDGGFKAKGVSYSELRDSILNGIMSHEIPPFTLQRFCELLTEPRAVYKNCAKFMWALERLVTFHSSISAETTASRASSDMPQSADNQFRPAAFSSQFTSV
eukprot:GCRY01000239.1.p1 GENE.GCRY01000239.1~~GCRY01000239.1.p1  ORF type:complete len:171 (+),score=16.04 GCRY01000239.1:251-763(+)